MVGPPLPGFYRIAETLSICRANNPTKCKLLFEDPRAAGCEPMGVRSGYNGNDMGAYFEVRDDRACFFVRALARGKHSVIYRMRADMFSALPAKGSAMYESELEGNSDEIKLGIVD
jgi:hypothetical protein